MPPKKKVEYKAKAPAAKSGPATTTTTAAPAPAPAPAPATTQKKPTTPQQSAATATTPAKTVTTSEARGEEKESEYKNDHPAAPYFQSLFTSVTGLAAIIITDKDGVIVFQSLNSAWSAIIKDEKEKDESSDDRTPTASSGSIGSAASKESGDKDRDGEGASESGRGEEGEGDEGGLEEPHENFGPWNHDSQPTASPLSSAFIPAFTLAAQQASRLSLGDNKTITAFYKNVTLIHANFDPLVITLVAGPTANLGLIFDRVVPDLRKKLATIRTSVSDHLREVEESTAAADAAAAAAAGPSTAASAAGGGGAGRGGRGRGREAEGEEDEEDQGQEKRGLLPRRRG